MFLKLLRDNSLCSEPGRLFHARIDGWMLESVLVCVWVVVLEVYTIMLCVNSHVTLHCRWMVAVLL